MSRPLTSTASGNNVYPRVIKAKVNLPFLYFHFDEFGLFLLVKGVAELIHLKEPFRLSKLSSNSMSMFAHVCFSVL